MNAHEQAELIIREYIDRLEFKGYFPRKIRVRKLPMKAGYFEYKSLSAWAAKEVLRYVRAHKNIPPAIAVEDFAHKMDQYSLGNSRIGGTFSVAYDIAMDILDIFIAMR